MIRYSLTGLLLVAAPIGLGCLALAKANESWRSVTVTATLLVLAIAALAGVYGRGGAKAFAGGMALIGWLYILLASLVELGDGLLTRSASTQLYAELHGLPPTVSEFMKIVAHSPNGATLTGTVDRTTAERLRIAFGQPPNPDDFYAIADCLWALLLGFLGGLLAWRWQRAEP